MNTSSTPTSSDAVSLEKSVRKPFPLSLTQSLVLGSSALFLGLLGNWLFRADALGLNWSLYLGLFAALLLGLTRRFELERPNLFLLGSLGLLALLFPWRASPFLQTLNVAVTLVFLGLLVTRLTWASLLRTNVSELAFNLFRAPFTLLPNLFHFFTGNRWSDLVPQDSRSFQAMRSALRGLAFAFPLVAIFALLLASADALFESFLSGLVSFDVGMLFNHLFVIGLFTLLTLALLAQTLIGERWHALEVNAPPLFRLGVIETSIVFGSLVALFLSFFAVQFGYLFGGERLLSTTGLSYAEYGRRGFFELVAVTVLLHLVLLSGLWLVSKGRAFAMYRVLATSLVVLLFGVIWSAHSRLGLYIDAYGLTELRYYSSAMIFWIGTVMLYFLVRLFYTHAPKVAPAYLALGLLGVVALYVSNPDARIAQVNLARVQHSELDAGYLDQLSLDAAPVIVRSLDTLPVEERSEVARDLRRKRRDLHAADWRSFNVGRWRGARALGDF